MMSDQRRKFNQQRCNAKRRNIAWQLTFDQWWTLWLVAVMANITALPPLH
jgi:hypothetical protein